MNLNIALFLLPEIALNCLSIAPAVNSSVPSSQRMPELMYTTKEKKTGYHWIVAFLLISSINWYALDTRFSGDLLNLTGSLDLNKFFNKSDVASAFSEL